MSEVQDVFTAEHVGTKQDRAWFTSPYVLKTRNGYTAVRRFSRLGLHPDATKYPVYLYLNRCSKR